jgi:hypothetical protein
VETSNKERLEGEISALITFLADERQEFFRLTENSLDSSDDFLNHFISKETFAKSKILGQAALNVQLLYIKLCSYYELTSAQELKSVRLPRQAFAHHSTDLIFCERTQYNFFFHKVSHNFRRFAYIFYKENVGEEFDEKSSKMLIFELDKDIKAFIDLWTKSKEVVPHPLGT